MTSFAGGELGDQFLVVIPMSVAEASIPACLVLMIFFSTCHYRDLSVPQHAGMS